MSPGFPLKLAFAAVSFYAFITVLFLNGKNRDESGSSPRIAETAQRPSAPERPFPPN